MTTAYFDLSAGSLTQDWSNTGLITANDIWSLVPSITGYLGNDLTTATGVDPTTYTGANVLGAVDVVANQTNPNAANLAGGVLEFELANPTIALNGSGTADAPSLVFYLNATGREDVRFQALLRDLDSSADDSIQQIAVQWRSGDSATWNNIAGGYYADVSAQNTATTTTAIDLTLPSAADGVATLQIRVLTTNAVGNDEATGVDDIVISSVAGGGGGDTTAPLLTASNPLDGATGVAEGANIVLTFNEAVAAGTGSITISDGAGDTRVIDVTDAAQVTVSGSTVTLNPTADLAQDTTYSVTFGAGVVDDAAGNDFAGLGAGALDFTTAAPPPPVVITQIYTIQGLSHTSPLNGQTVTTEGVVTALDINGGRGFYIQAVTGDGDVGTSDGIFVFTNAAPTVAVGDLVRVAGTVSEFLPGGAATNLTGTQLISPTTTVIGTAPVVATLLGQGGRLAPTETIEDDAFTSFDPTTDGIDFYESLEGMLVTVQDAQVVGVFGGQSEVWVVTDNGANATGIGPVGGIAISPGDLNPERIQIDNDSGFFGGVNQFAGGVPSTGDRLGDVTGIVTYNFGNFEVQPIAAVVPIVDVTVARETSTLDGSASRLSVATYNVLNLDANDNAANTAQYAQLATDIVDDLNSPDIIALQEVQDNNGATNNGVVSGQLTGDRLAAAIFAAGGPQYIYVEIAPVDGTNGGEPGGNIRNGYLYNPARVTLNNLELVDPTNPAFVASRKPLAGEFSFNGETITLVNVHSSSRTGSTPLFGSTQPPINADDDVRLAQSTVVRGYVEAIVAADPNARVAVLGDFNAFYFEPAVLAIDDIPGFRNVTDSLNVGDRYSLSFDGNNQQIDHVIASSALDNGTQVDIVHINVDRFPVPGLSIGSDHDPILTTFLIPVDTINGTENADAITGTALSEPINGLGGADTIRSGGGDDTINGGAGNDLIGGDTLFGALTVDGGTGSDTFIVSSAGETVVVDLAAGTVTGGYQDGSTLTGIEFLRTNPGALGAAVEFYGNGLANVLSGGSGDDILDGRAGNDKLSSGLGDDTLTGGAGNDQFIFRRDEIGGGMNTVTDFMGAGVAGGDTLLFQGFGAGATVTNIGGNMYQVNSSFGAMMFQLTGVTTLNAGDVQFI